MINTDDLELVSSVIESHLLTYTNIATKYYKYGSYNTTKLYNDNIKYLEVYNYIINRVLDLSRNNIDYNDYGFTDNSIAYVIDKANELIFYFSN